MIQSAVEVQETIVFDARGAYLAFVFFSLIVLVPTGMFLRRIAVRAGLARRSFLILLGIAVGLTFTSLYYWLFWNRFYEARVTDAAVEFVLEAPRRGLSIPRHSISGVAAQTGNRFWQRRVVVSTTDGRQLFSPDMSDDAARQAAQFLEKTRR